MRARLLAVAAVVLVGAPGSGLAASVADPYVSSAVGCGHIDFDAAPSSPAGEGRARITSVRNTSCRYARSIVAYCGRQALLPSPAWTAHVVGSHFALYYKRKIIRGVGLAGAELRCLEAYA